MAVNKAIRADDVSGLNIATTQFSDTDAVTKDFQRVVINNSTDGTMAAVTGAGLKVDASGATVPVSLSGTLNSRPSDGTNPITKTFDLDSGAGTEYNLGVGLRKAASGGSVEAGTASDPIRVDTTGTTVQPVSGTFWQSVQPVSGTVTTTPPSNASTNVAQLAGTTTDTNSGVKSAGTLRVVLATDQPALTNKLLVTPDSVALPANQSVNVNQLAGTTTDTNSGVKSAGTLRVVLATDQPALTNKLLVTPDSVALPANQSVNVNQLAGTGTDTNSGNKSAGTLRVVLATDQPALTNKLLVTADPITFSSAQAVTQSGTWTVQPGNTANTTPWLVQDVGQATGGMSFFSASVTSTKTQVKGSAGTLYGITAVNNGSALAYIQVFNKVSANVTVGTTAPDYVVPVPAPSSGTAGAGIREEYSKGMALGTGITVACTTTRTGSTSATCDVNMNYT